MTVLLRTVLPACWRRIVGHISQWSKPSPTSHQNCGCGLPFSSPIFAFIGSFQTAIISLQSFCLCLPSLKRAASKMRPIVGQPTPSNQQSRVIRER
ncbi:hypothetical protein QC764_0047990 [Podospora pseudoanserina]|nr:hypothetical protein QC764_0047990 [Podospora pseudoanserina]